MKKSSQIQKITHITIGVSDLKKSVSFFQDVLGLEKIGEWPAYAIFDIAGLSFGLEPKSKTEICFLVDDVDNTYRNLEDKEVNFVTKPKDQPWGVRDATFLDPDGNTFIIESFRCEVCGKTCQNYRELLEEHLRKHRQE
jgi:lactoylglutathione lyase